MLLHRIHRLRFAVETVSRATFTIAVIMIASFIFVATQSAAQDAPPSPAAQAQPSVTAEQLVAGKADFNKHCAPCHGTNAKGHGPEVSVIPGIKPSDLTLISRNNGGVFPYEEVADTIDGRKGVPSHKRFDMPFWGVNFQQEGKEFSPDSEAAAKARIDAVVAYIATIQAN